MLVLMLVPDAQEMLLAEGLEFPAHPAGVETSTPWYALVTVAYREVSYRLEKKTQGVVTHLAGGMEVVEMADVHQEGKEGCLEEGRQVASPEEAFQVEGSRQMAEAALGNQAEGTYLEEMTCQAEGREGRLESQAAATHHEGKAAHLGAYP